MRTPIAIVGRGCVLPGANSPGELWEKLRAGSDLLSRPPAGAWPVESDFVTLDLAGNRWSERGGYVDGFQFDPTGFAVGPEELLQADRVAHWVLHASRAALREAGHDSQLGHRRTGAILGHLSLPLPSQAGFAIDIWLRRWAQAQGQPELANAVLPVTPAPFNRYMSAIPTRFLSRALGLGGEAFTLDAACASSLYAIKLACDALEDGRSDLMLAGAACGTSPMFLHIGFRALKALSPTGQSRPFHRQANGLVPSEGAVVLALKRLADAESAGDRILGVIRGIGLTNDRGAAGLLVPSSEGQARAMRQALDDAALSHADVAMLECHATGTPVGDGIELASIGRVYGACKDLPIGSLKSQMGHLLTVSGGAALLKVLAGFEADRLPPSLPVDDPIDSIANAQVRLISADEPWPTGSRRIVGISSFGFGGNNAHLLVQAHGSGEIRRSHIAYRSTSAPLAVIGLGVICAGAGDTREFTESLLSGKEALQDHPKLGRCGLAPTFHLAPHEIKFPPWDLADSLPQQVIVLKAVGEALSNVRGLNPQRTGVLAGMECDPEISRHLARGMVPAWIDTWNKSLRVSIDEDWLDRMSDGFSKPLKAAAVTGSLPNIIANRLNAQLKLGGPGYTVSSDELSGLRALEIAARSLRRHELDAAIVAAVDLCCEPVTARAAAGLQGKGREMPGDAAVVLVLKRLDDAQRDGDAVLAVIDDDIQPEAQANPEAQNCLYLGDAEGAFHLGTRYGHAHAASGLLHVAAAVVACHQGAWLVPGRALAWPASDIARKACITFRSQDGQQSTVKLRAYTTERKGAGAPAAPGSMDPRRCAGTAMRAVVGGIQFESHMPEIKLPPWPYRPEEFSTQAQAPDPSPEGFYLPLAKSPMKTIDRPVHVAVESTAPRPIWTRADLEEMTQGRLSRFFGKPFAVQDGNERQARMPAPPMLLLDRVMAIEGQPGAMGSGHLITETDTRADAWYLRQGGMPPSLEVEVAGQASILLTSYLGADLINGEERVYRMLGIEVTYHSERRPSAGDTLRLELHITGHATAGRASLFFFRCEAHLNGKSHFTVLNGQAGLFPPEEIGKASGILWDAAKETPGEHPQHLDLAPNPVACEFSAKQVSAFYAGQLQECFGEERSITARPLSPRTLQSEQMQWIDRVDRFDPHGGPWGRGYLKARYQIRGDEWVFKSHFKNDPTLPGWVMCEAGLQMMGFYLAALGYPFGSNGHSLIPVPSTHFKVMCRADATPTSGAMTCEVFVRALEEGPDPTLWADILITAAGRKTFHGRNLGLRLRSATPKPLWSRTDLEEMSHGQLSKFFGPQFKAQDGHARQVRMPMPPLLLADRVMEIKGEPGSMGLGRIVTETDITADAWYLHEGSMPAGLEVEAGQADLLLISYLGADLLNRGERVYRLLGCEMTYHGDHRPRVGDTLRYEIEVIGHANTGAIRLFFFRYDSYLNGKRRLSVRNGRAGFFTSTELDNAGGVLWDPAKDGTDESIPHASSAIVETPRAFSREKVSAFASGRAYDCFGAGFERMASHHRTPRIQEGRMQLFQQVELLDPKGGPWGRGYLRATYRIQGDEWFFPGHFHNDPTMPGTLMCEAGIQMMAFYLAALGQTIACDGWTFELVPSTTFKATCRGQVTPQSRDMTYEIFVRGLELGAHPTLRADVLLTVDGRKAFHGRDLCVRLWPGVPLARAVPPIPAPGARPPAQVDGFTFDGAAMLHCATGLPSLAFGPLFKPFDGARNLPRLPSDPYQFMSRVTRCEGPLGKMQVGSAVEIEYDIPDNAWYFEDNDSHTMPFAVLLEAALQPCGWLAAYMGVPLHCDTDLHFRNLDGDGTLLRPVFRGDGILRTSARCTSISRNGDIFIEAFDVECRLGEEIIYTLKTVFGHFTAEALSAQKGLPATASEREAMQAQHGQPVDLVSQGASHELPRLAHGQLLMLDRVTGYWPQGGAAGRGRLLAQFDVDPKAWFFKAHFYRDPVQPGSLGIEAMIQLLQYYMRDRGLADGMQRPRFEPLASGRPMAWKYRGQVLPKKHRVSVEMEIADEGRDGQGPWVSANAWLWVDGLRIYSSKGLSMRVVESIEKS